jgi:hypothetical protein
MISGRAGASREGIPWPSVDLHSSLGLLGSHISRRYVRLKFFHGAQIGTGDEFLYT